MRRSLFLLTAWILALIRVFVLGVAAVSIGMSDFGGVSSSLLRIFQLYTLLFVYIVMLQYFKPAAREFLKTPTLVVAGVAPVLSVLALLALLHGSKTSLPADPVKTGGAILFIILLDVVILGLLAMDALKHQTATPSVPPKEEHTTALGTSEEEARAQVSDTAHDIPEHEVS